MMLDSPEILQKEEPEEKRADADWSAVEETLVTEEPENEDVIVLKIEKPVLLFWGWVGFGVAILSFYYPLLPGLSFAVLATWAVLKSSPHLAERLAEHPRVKKYMPMIRGDEDLPRTAKYVIAGVMAIASIAIFITEGQLALVAFGLFVCLPVVGLVWGKPFTSEPNEG